ncbi:DUF3107 domain-containing protein [Paenarthrobacter sp. Z7-10]|uniref:DUF3107 domain-containing protein n=1 Tax=Paenarthrobacter sp. Z7-10 TaxID=2787635 RepID=UPI0022A9177E|nr:DUF3107 domain-containing protein [Paenarthrobacter sp. Z7-10]MCZ2403223.1 DUF3107 domain-containing protein [Paenarthrobacter sp. Z7-10]
MEVKIGIQNVNREIVLDSAQTAEEVTKLVADAVSNKTELRLTDEKGRVIIVPGTVLGYVEVGAEESRRVGFGAL